MKLWQKSIPTQEKVDRFTQGKDIEMDTYLAKFDILGSLAHIKMLYQIKILTYEEFNQLSEALRKLYLEIENNQFVIDENMEDIHSYIEYRLTNSIGEAGKKIHTARSRNDQVLLDIKLFLRSEVEELILHIEKLFHVFIKLSNQYKDFLMPGYTHFQLAMPSSFGLWFGGYAESLLDDMITIKAAYSIINKNPLGSAAGYGSSFPIQRKLTTEYLGFEDLNYNAINAQMNRGKVERITASAIANFADTLARFSNDACTFLNQNFGFISFPSELTTGSSIMPHKKNPDVFELVRSYCNRIKALPNEIIIMTTNLPLGYNRDLQLIKEHIFPVFSNLHDCIDMVQLMLEKIEIQPDILKDKKYLYLFTVEKINQLVITGTPFRTAYKQVVDMIEQEKFDFKGEITHIHEGSIGNLCNQAIVSSMEKLIQSFHFENVHVAIETLLTREKIEIKN